MKDKKMPFIIKEMAYSGNKYMINGIDLTEAVFYIRKDRELFKIVAPGDYTIIYEGTNTFLEITNTKILTDVISVQIVYFLTPKSGKYETGTDPDINILVDSYNKLVDDFKSLWSYIQKQVFVSDTSIMPLLFPLLSEGETWVFKDGEMRAVLLYDAIEELRKSVEQVRQEIKTELENKINEFDTRINTLIAGFRTEIRDIIDTGKSDINTIINTFNTDWMALIAQSKKEINDLTVSNKATITELANASKNEITTHTTNQKNSITTLTNNSKTEINTLVTDQKNSITTLVNNSKTEITTHATNQKNSITTLINNSKTEINTLVQNEKTNITNLSTTERTDITDLAEDKKDEIRELAAQIVGFDPDDYYTKTEIDTMLSGVSENINTIFVGNIPLFDEDSVNCTIPGVLENINKGILIITVGDMQTDWFDLTFPVLALSEYYGFFVPDVYQGNILLLIKVIRQGNDIYFTSINYTVESEMSIKKIRHIK